MTPTTATAKAQGVTPPTAIPTARSGNDEVSRPVKAAPRAEQRLLSARGRLDR